MELIGLINFKSLMRESEILKHQSKTTFLEVLVLN